MTVHVVAIDLIATGRRLEPRGQIAAEGHGAAVRSVENHQQHLAGTNVRGDVGVGTVLGQQTITDERAGGEIVEELLAAEGQKNHFTKQEGISTGRKPRTFIIQ